MIRSKFLSVGLRDAGTGNVLRSRGIAFARYEDLMSYCAVVAELQIHHTSGIVQSTSWTLNEAARFDRSDITLGSWADYPILRFSEVPAVEGIQCPPERSLGVGEAAQEPAAAAIANAVAAATGRCVHDIPLTPERVNSVLA